MDQWQLEEFVKVFKRCKVKVVTQETRRGTLHGAVAASNPFQVSSQAVADSSEESMERMRRSR